MLLYSDAPLMHKTPPSPPKFKLAQQEILSWIRSGRLQPGAQLPGEQAIAAELGLNHRTVRRGLDDLARAGVIQKLPRVGNFVRDIPPRELTVTLALVYPRYLFESYAQPPSIGALVGGVCSEVDLRDYSLVTMSYGPGRLWDDLGASLIEREVRGILLYPQRDITVEEIRRLEENNIRVIFVGTIHHQRLAQAASGAVWVSTNKVLQSLMTRLIDAGHRRIRFAMYTEFPRRVELEAIVEDVCRRSNIGSAADVIFDMPNRTTADYSRLELLLDESPAPTAIIVSDDVSASELMRACYRRGIQIPRDLSICSVHNATPLAFPVQLASPNSMRYLAMSGQEAAQRMIALLAGQTLDVPIKEIPAEIDADESIGSPRQSLQLNPRLED